MPAIATTPSDQAASIGSKPISTRYLVWWICTEYQIQPPAKKLSASHQKRPVRTARGTVHSTAAHFVSTTLDGRFLAAPAVACRSPSGSRPRLSGLLATRRLI